MGTSLGPKYILYTYMDSLGKHKIILQTTLLYQKDSSLRAFSPLVAQSPPALVLIAGKTLGVLSSFQGYGPFQAKGPFVGFPLKGFITCWGM